MCKKKKRGTCVHSLQRHDHIYILICIGLLLLLLFSSTFASICNPPLRCKCQLAVSTSIVPVYTLYTSISVVMTPKVTVVKPRR